MSAAEAASAIAPSDNNEDGVAEISQGSVTFPSRLPDATYNYKSTIATGQRRF
jgi:hypothetical protein